MEVLKKIPHFVINSAKNLIQKDKFFAILTLVFVLPLIFLWGRFGDPVIDCGREAYIPYSMAYLGKILFKDIICIYGPVPYYLNAAAVKLFGAGLNTMYFIGALLSFVFLLALYSLAKRFLKDYLAFIYCLVILFVCVFNPSISNFIFPYSYAIVYALVFAVFHLIFLIKFIDNKNPKNLYFAAFFLSLCVFSKYDFAPCALVMMLLMFYYRKNIDFKSFLYVLLFFFLVPVALLTIFILQKVTPSDIIFNFKMISNMAHSPSLQYFYTVCTGYFFEFKKTFMFLPNFLYSSFIFTIMGFLGYLSLKTKNIILNIIAFFVIIGFSMLLLINHMRYIFVYLPLLVLFFFIVKIANFVYKKFKIPEIKIPDDDIISFTFILFSILFSLKSLFGLFHELYGTFYLPFILLAFYLAIFSFFKTRKTLALQGSKTVSIIFIALFIIQNFKIFYFVKNNPVKTPAGTIFTGFQLAETMNSAIDYIKKNNPEKSLLVLPEGLMFNFILKKDYPYFNTSFTPLDFDAYGETYLTERVLANLPDNILFLSRDYSDYGKTFLCKDFGLEFCTKINDRYTFVRSFIGNHTLNKQNDPYYGYQMYLFERKTND